MKEPEALNFRTYMNENIIPAENKNSESKHANANSNWWNTSRKDFCSKITIDITLQVMPIGATIEMRTPLILKWKCIYDMS